MICEKCYRGVADGVALYRQNAKGSGGIWRCGDCNKKKVDGNVAQLVSMILEKKNGHGQ